LETSAVAVDVVDALLAKPFAFAAAVLDLIVVFDLRERIAVALVAFAVAVAVAVADTPAIVPAVAHLSYKAYADPCQDVAEATSSSVRFLHQSLAHGRVDGLSASFFLFEYFDLPLAELQMLILLTVPK
jgi:hypothetical protein